MNDFLALLEKKKADLQAASGPAALSHVPMWPSSSAITRPPQPIQPPPPPPSLSGPVTSLPSPAAHQPYFYNQQPLNYTQPYPPMPFLQPTVPPPMYLQPTAFMYPPSFSSPAALHQNLYQYPLPQQPPTAPRPFKKTKPPSTTPAAATTTPIDSNQEYYCEPCDKSFKKEFDYQAHCKTHETCTHLGCSFVGSKKVVLAHFHSKHGLYAGDGYKMIDVEGQKFNLLLGYSPEEIENWKKERRSKFPTAKKLEEECKEAKNLSDNTPTKGKKKSLQNNKRVGEDQLITDSNGIKRKKTNHPAAQPKLTIPKPLDGGARGTLLKKLLANQITEEEQIVLACIKYICDNGFFLEKDTTVGREMESQNEDTPVEEEVNTDHQQAN